MESVIETDRFSVDDDQIDFGMRNAEGFNPIFDARMAIKFVTERFFALLGLQKIVQLLVKAEARGVFVWHR